MVQTNKYTGIILAIITLCLAITIGFYSYGRKDYTKVEATVTYISQTTNPKNSNVDYDVQFEYSMKGTDYQGTICISNADKYKIGNTAKIWVNSNNPTEIDDDTFYKYLLPFFAIVLFVDVAVIIQYFKNRKI